MEIYRWIWGLLTIAALGWYSTVTIYIAFHGVTDIKQMLKSLGSGTFNADKPEG